MKLYKNWYWLVIGLIFLTLMLVSLLNYMVDPQHVFGRPVAEGLNKKKIEKNEYLLKARDIALIKPDVLLLGSSRTSIGLDPEYYMKLFDGTAYNGGLSSADIYVQLRYLQYAINSSPSLSRVILGLDFAGFNENSNLPATFNEERLHSNQLTSYDLKTHLLTASSFIDSIKVIYDNLFAQEKYTADNYLPYGDHNDALLARQHQRLLEEGNNRFYGHLKQYIYGEGFYSSYQLSEKKMDFFRKIVSLCEENNIELIVFIHPAHALQWEGIRKTGLWDEFERWKKELVNIRPVWDFSGYHSVTTTPPDNFNNYTDQSHYRKHIGNFVFNRVLSINEEDVPADFGVYLTKDNIAVHLKRIKEGREQWARNNPDIIELLEEL